MENKNNIPDPRAMEKMSADLSRLLEGREFQSEEEVNEYLNKILKKGEFPKTSSKSAVQFAQDIVYEAWETQSKKERIRLAKEALSVSSDCGDAYNLLAEEEAKTLEEALELYRQGMEAGRRALGKKFFKENKGHLWGHIEARPYMRSCAGYMECLWQLGKYEEAITEAEKMLRLNKNDNQGIRYILAGYLLALGRYEELDKFLNYGEYKYDGAAEWFYTRALLSFVKEGDSERANKDLKIALESNRYVPEYLTGKKPIPRILPDTITVHGEDEGFCYAARYLQGWKKVPGAIDWLREKAGIKIFPKVGRNELCPCGSGRKYKRCCGG